MELLITLVFWLALVYGVYVWADSKGRNAVAWALVAALISPLITAIVLAFVPKTIEKQAEEHKRMKELMNE